MLRIKHLLPFPALRQSTPWSCGAAAVQMVLAYYGKDVREDKLRSLAGTTPKCGTTITGMQRVLRRHTLRLTAGHMTVPDVKRFIDRKIPVIILLQAWTTKKRINWQTDWSDGHYAVAIGYDARRIMFADPASLYRTALTYQELDKRWHDIDAGKTHYDHFGIAVYGKPPTYHPDKIVQMD